MLVVSSAPVTTVEFLAIVNSGLGQWLTPSKLTMPITNALSLSVARNFKSIIKAIDYSIPLSETYIDFPIYVGRTLAGVYFYTPCTSNMIEVSQSKNNQFDFHGDQSYESYTDAYVCFAHSARTFRLDEDENGYCRTVREVLDCKYEDCLFTNYDLIFVNRTIMELHLIGTLNFATGENGSTASATQRFIDICNDSYTSNRARCCNPRMTLKHINLWIRATKTTYFPSPY